jgi:phosphomannomutase
LAIIKSISGIRGTIGGYEGECLTPADVLKYAAAYGQFIKDNDWGHTIVIGRDARESGESIGCLLVGTLTSLGFHIIDLGLSTTPTVEMAVLMEKAAGGIIISASHNPANWNALKLLDNKGEFLSSEAGSQVLALADADNIKYNTSNAYGTVTKIDDYIDRHIEEILKIDLVDPEKIKEANFRIAVDAVNSTGGIAVPKLLDALGVRDIECLNCEPNGKFPHNPEPLPENLSEISSKVESGDFNLGIVVDPDVDRLAFICEDGTAFGEEYTLVTVADYILQHKKGNTVSNLSSTRALRDVTEKAEGAYHASAVGEVNVVEKMKEVDAVIGGEGNGGIIFPKLHYGRDALVGIALFLTYLAEYGKSVKMLRKSYPDYFIAKKKIELTPEINTLEVLNAMAERYSREKLNRIDGLKIEFESGQWVHLRQSNTEPIIRIYAETDSMSTAEHLANKIISDIKETITESEEA